MNNNLLMLRKAMDDAKVAYDTLGHLNVASVLAISVEDRVAVDIKIETAKRKWLDAHLAYQRAVEQFCESSTG